jgi:hypothetical protein
MVRRIAALLVVSVVLHIAQVAAAQSAMCPETGIAVGSDRMEAAAAPEPAPPRDEELPWCLNAGDPRCAPLHGSGVPLGAGLRPALSCDTELGVEHRASAGDVSFTACAGQPPRTREHGRVERPPR